MIETKIAIAAATIAIARMGVDTVGKLAIGFKAFLLHFLRMVRACAG